MTGLDLFAWIVLIILIATLVVGRWVGGVDMPTATAELRAGFAETVEVSGKGTGHAA